MQQTISKQIELSWPSVGALWSLFWRAVVWVPFAAVYGVLWVMLWPLLILLPFCEVVLLINGDWLSAGIVPAAWVALFLLKHSRWFTFDSRFFPNEQENV